MITINHLGAKNCVTGSCHLIQTQPGAAHSINILVDCGKAQGHDPELPFDQFPVPQKKIHYLFLTHDHIDRVPDLIEAGFKGEIICTHATKTLLLPMHSPSRVETPDRRKKLEAAIDDLSWGFELYETFTLKKGISFTLYNASHILGSCFIRFTFPRHCPTPQSHLPKNPPTQHSVIFSGDLGCTNTPILPDPDVPPSCDFLILESTYGDRNHTRREHRIVTLEHLLEKALADNGIVYIPAFSLGRTQELIYELDRIKTKVPVFIDSPLGLKITKIYADLEGFWDQEAME